MGNIRGPRTGTHFDTFHDVDSGMEWRVMKGRNQAGRHVCTTPGRGSTARMLTRTDLLRVLGARWETPGGMEFFVGTAPDGTTRVWKPRGTRQQLGGFYGSFATPLQTITGVTSGTFTQKIAVPAGLLYVGSILHARAHLRKTGTAANGTLTLNFGTAGNGTDSAIVGQTVGSATNRDLLLDAFCKVVATNTLSCDGAIGLNADANNVGADVTTNINTAAAMSLSYNLVTVNAADSYKLTRIELFIEGP